jgi:aspartyl-tRNA(Asn)/glutamyl-tRNA(Gln) amidotransferase subunit A
VTADAACVEALRAAGAVIIGKTVLHEIDPAGVHPLAPSLDHVGVFAGSVRDAALAHAVLAGARTEPVADGAVVGWFPPPALGPVDPDVDARVRRTLRDAFPRGEGVAFDLAGELFTLFATLQLSEASAVHADVIEPGAGQIDPEVLARLRKGAGIPAWRYLQAVERRSALAARIAALFERVDVLALPTVPTVATELGVRTREIGGVAAEIRSALLSLTCLWNLTGDPALTIPAGKVAGLPVGLQLVAARGRERMLFGVAEAIERAAVMSIKTVGKL